jgi:alkylation response protein AidB-like acyl-CoA dehydrogenase
MTPQVLFDDPDGTLAMLRDSVAAFAARHSGTKALRERRDRGGDFDQSLWLAMADAGWVGLSLPDHIGGAGLGMREQAILSEALGRALVAEPMVMASAFSCVLLADAPDSNERTRLGAGLPSGRVVVIPAWKDPARHSRAKPISARAKDNGFVLDGEKHFVEAARAATDFLVTAAEDDGCTLISVAADAAGLTITERPGIDGAAIATLSFSGCYVPRERLLARAAHAAELLDRPVLHARLALAAELAGIASKALELAMSYTKERVQFGKPIASFQAIQHRLVDMWTDAEFACAAVVNAVETLDAGDDGAAHLAVLAAKARAGDAAFSICRRAVHLFGAMGFTDECDIGLYLKRAINLNATLGQPDELRLQFVERERGLVRGRNNG